MPLSAPQPSLPGVPLLPGLAWWSSPKLFSLGLFRSHMAFVLALSPAFWDTTICGYPLSCRLNLLDGRLPANIKTCSFLPCSNPQTKSSTDPPRTPCSTSGATHLLFSPLRPNYPLGLLHLTSHPPATRAARVLAQVSHDQDGACEARPFSPQSLRSLLTPLF